MTITTTTILYIPQFYLKPRQRNFHKTMTRCTSKLNLKLFTCLFQIVIQENTKLMLKYQLCDNATFVTNHEE